MLNSDFENHYIELKKYFKIISLYVGAFSNAAVGYMFNVLVFKKGHR